MGFYGTSDTCGMCENFGIVSVSRDAILPGSVYDMRELQNKPEEDGHCNKRNPLVRSPPDIRFDIWPTLPCLQEPGEHDSDEEISSVNDKDTSEDEDDDYDD